MAEITSPGRDAPSTASTKEGRERMVFNSFGFIFLFFPPFLILYRRAPRRFCQALLCAGSLVFFGIGVKDAPWQLLLLLGLTGFGLLGCAAFRRPSLRKRGVLALFVAVTAAPLAWVKLAGLLRPDAPALPLGLSFYTFQLIAFLVYAYQGGETTALGVAVGTLMFPKLISGPLAEPEAILREAAAPRRNRRRLDEGLEAFLLGLACKVVVADHLAGVLGQIRTWGVRAVSPQLTWIGVIAYALQLYFDFWGYSRMAVGLGLMLGIRLPENFNHPYCAASVADFWRRWHITLGQWFRVHVYIPLGGSRKGAARMALATLAVWLLTGVWHGAGWNYLLWGLAMALLILGERLLYGRALGRHPLLAHLYVPLVIGLSWVFFITPTPAEAGAYFLRLIGLGGIGHGAGDWLEALRWSWPYLALGAAMSTPLPQRLWAKLSGTAAAWALLFGLFWVCAYFLATAASDPFLYFSF